MALPPSIVKFENVWFNASAAPTNLAKLQPNIFYLNSDDHHHNEEICFHSHTCTYYYYTLAQFLRFG